MSGHLLFINSEQKVNIMGAWTEKRRSIQWVWWLSYLRPFSQISFIWWSVFGMCFLLPNELSVILHKPFSTHHTRTIISKSLHWITSAFFCLKFHLGWVKVMCLKSPSQPLQPVTSLKLSNGTAPCTVHDYPLSPTPCCPGSRFT